MINLALTDAQGFLRKISNNLLNCGDDKVPAFTLPIEGISLDADALDALLGKFTHRSWFDKKRDGAYHPMPWWEAREKRDFHLSAELECDEVTLTLAAGKKITFEAEGDHDDEDEPYTPGAKISHLVLTPQPGGTTLLAFHLTVRPGIGKENLALQEAQFHHIGITIEETREAKRKAAQGSLALAPAEPEGDGEPPARGRTKSSADVAREMAGRQAH